MKITICGSMYFASKMLEAKRELEKMNHEVFLPSDIHECLVDPDLKDNLDKDYEKNLRHCIERNLLRDGINNVEKSDAILVFNETKNDIQGYIGTAVLMELGVAFYLNKKIYILNDIDHAQKYSLEVDLTQPIFLGGSLDNIK